MTSALEAELLEVERRVLGLDRDRRSVEDRVRRLEDQRWMTSVNPNRGVGTTLWLVTVVGGSNAATTLANCTVTLTNLDVGAVVDAQTTDLNGQVQFSPPIVGQYQVSATFPPRMGGATWNSSFEPGAFLETTLSLQPLAGYGWFRDCPVAVLVDLSGSDPFGAGWSLGQGSRTATGQVVENRFGPDTLGAGSFTGEYGLDFASGDLRFGYYSDGGPFSGYPLGDAADRGGLNVFSTSLGAGVLLSYTCPTTAGGKFTGVWQFTGAYGRADTAKVYGASPATITLAEP